MRVTLILLLLAGACLASPMLKKHKATSTTPEPEKAPVEKYTYTVFGWDFQLPDWCYSVMDWTFGATPKFDKVKLPENFNQTRQFVKKLVHDVTKDGRSRSFAAAYLNGMVFVILYTCLLVKQVTLSLKIQKARQTVPVKAKGLRRQHTLSPIERTTLPRDGEAVEMEMNRNDSPSMLAFGGSIPTISSSIMPQFDPIDLRDRAAEREERTDRTQESGEEEEEDVKTGGSGTSSKGRPARLEDLADLFSPDGSRRKVTPAVVNRVGSSPGGEEIRSSPHV